MTLSVGGGLLARPFDTHTNRVAFSFITVFTLGHPADKLIAATSIVHKIPLLTRDRRIRDSRIVPLA
jgi:predicted nucleic acid-binding protein